MKIRIYLVDDHPLIRKGIASLIEGEPDMAVCGESGEDAIAVRAIRELRPDVIIVDLALGGHSGLDLIRTVKAFDPGIGIIVLSVHDEALYGLRSLNAGARSYIRKADAAPKLVDAIRNVWQGKVVVSAHLTSRLLDRIRTGNVATSQSPLSGLSDRELEVVELIGRGLSTGEIASSLKLSVKTVETHRGHIKEKLQLGNATQLVQFCTHVHCRRELSGGADSMIGSNAKLAPVAADAKAAP